jgi:hypothetical protein
MMFVNTLMVQTMADRSKFKVSVKAAVLWWYGVICL